MKSKATYKGRTWVTNTLSQKFHCTPEAESRGRCSCIRCLVDCTIMQDPLAGPAVFNEGEEKEAGLVGLYLKDTD